MGAETKEKTELVTRIQALATVLSACNPSEYHRLSCIGVMNDKDYEKTSKGGRRIGLVYELPVQIDAEPKTLLDLLKFAKQSRTRPPLGEKFEFAYKLASSMSLFHATNWLHKSFRSDNVLFSPNGPVTQPYIAGFHYSRPLETQSRKELDPN